MRKRIGILAPASAPRDQALVSQGRNRLASLGYETVSYRTTFPPEGYLAGSDAVRLKELNYFIHRQDIDLLLCVRGGYGTLRILDDVDYEAAKRHPKVLIGYSDITALQWALYHKSGWRSISGPMVAVEWPHPDPVSEQLFLDVIHGSYPRKVIGPAQEELHAVRSGEATGMLMGGNLTLITRLIGTPYMPDLRGVILYLEEVGESPYRIDGLFAQLKLAGILDQLGGLVLGGFTESESASSSPSLSLHAVLSHYTSPLLCPVATGLAYGHFPSKNTLPIGTTAHLDCMSETATLTLLDAPI